MDVSAAGLAHTFAATQAAAREQTTAMVTLRQQAQAEQGIVALLEANAETGKPPAALPDGQGRQVDILA